jgi:formylglycine-generating enzyme required for sulfatase activity
VSEPASSPAAVGIDSQFGEELGNGVILEMAPIPGGSFIMGAPAGEPDSDANERPQHRVSVPPYFMGRCAVTIAQWKVARTFADEPIVRSSKIGFRLAMSAR